MALTQSTISSRATIFGALTKNYFEAVTSPLKERDYHRVEIAFDQCWPASIKIAE